MTHKRHKVTPLPPQNYPATALTQAQDPIAYYAPDFFEGVQFGIGRDLSFRAADAVEFARCGRRSTFLVSTRARRVSHSSAWRTFRGPRRLRVFLRYVTNFRDS